MPNKGTKNKKKAKHKNPPSKKRDTTSQESKPRTDELVDMITEASKKDLNDNKQQKFMSLAKDLHYDEILAGLSHAYLYPSNVLISDVDNKEYNNSVLEIDFSSEKGRVFKKTLAYINTNNKNYQEFVRKVQKIQRRDIKISLLDIFDIIYCKIQDTIKNISIITEEDISSIKQNDPFSSNIR